MSKSRPTKAADNHRSPTCGRGTTVRLVLATDGGPALRRLPVGEAPYMDAPESGQHPFATLFQTAGLAPDFGASRSPLQGEPYPIWGERRLTGSGRLAARRVSQSLRAEW